MNSTSFVRFAIIIFVRQWAVKTKVAPTRWSYTKQKKQKKNWRFENWATKGWLIVIAELKTFFAHIYRLYVQWHVFNSQSLSLFKSKSLTMALSLKFQQRFAPIKVRYWLARSWFWSRLRIVGWVTATRWSKARCQPSMEYNSYAVNHSQHDVLCFALYDQRMILFSPSPLSDEGMMDSVAPPLDPLD